MNFVLCISGVEEISDGRMDFWQTNLIELYKKTENYSERQRITEFRKQCRADREYRSINEGREYFQIAETAERRAKEKRDQN